MANKVIAIVDINNDQYQNIETLLFANILEKKCKKLCVMDLNPYNKSNSFLDIDKFKETKEIWTGKVFDRSTYIFGSVKALMGLKMNNLAKELMEKNDILLINPNQTKFDFNTEFYKLASDIVIFADIKKDVSSNLVNFFVKHNLHDKHVHIFIYNYQDNMQCSKTYLSLLNQFKSTKLVINTVSNIDQFNNIDEISNIDPWIDIYKKINGAF